MYEAHALVCSCSFVRFLGFCVPPRLGRFVQFRADSGVVRSACSRVFCLQKVGFRLFRQTETLSWFPHPRFCSDPHQMRFSGFLSSCSSVSSVLSCVVGGRWPRAGGDGEPQVPQAFFSGEKAHARLRAQRALGQKSKGLDHACEREARKRVQNPL